MLRFLILLVWLVSLALNAPGHLSVDSVIQLLEGRSGVYAGSHPPLMSALLGAFDGLVPGTALYLVFSSSLFYLPLMALVGGDQRRGAANWLAGGLLVFALATPLLLIYQGTVWKDVLFANFTLSTFTCLVLARRNQNRRAVALGLLVMAAIFAALAASTRQNGLLIWPYAAIAIGFSVSASASRSVRIGYALAWSLLVGCAFLAVKASTEAAALRPIGSSLSWGLTVLHEYDMVGMIARGASPFDATLASSPEAQRIAAAARRDYDPSRRDTLKNNEEFRQYFGNVGNLPERWWQMVRENPLAWLEHRAAVFRWMTAPPDARLCLPVWVGVDGLDSTLAALGIERQVRPQDAALYQYSILWLDTPLFINAVWAMAALALVGLILLRKGRAPGDGIVVAMLASSLAFAASFALIGIACDVRYLFLLPVACCGALAHLAHAPPQLSPTPSGASVGQ